MKENKSKIGLGIFIGVLVSLVICLTGFIIYDKFINVNDNDNNNNNNNNDNDSNNKNVIEGSNQDDIITSTPTPTTTNKPATAEDVDLDSDIVKELLTKFTSIDADALCYGYYDVYRGRDTADLYYHKKNSQLAAELSDSHKNMILAGELNNNSNGAGTAQFSKSELDRIYHNLFGSQAKALEVYKNGCPSLEINENGDYVFNGSSCGDIWNPGYHTVIFTQFYKAEKTTNELYLYELVGYPKYNDENKSDTAHWLDDDFTLYKDYNLTIKTSGTNKNLLDTNLKHLYVNCGGDSSDFGYDLTKIKEELNAYKYTFKKNSDNSYYFYQVEKVN